MANFSISDEGSFKALGAEKLKEEYQDYSHNGKVNIFGNTEKNFTMGQKKSDSKSMPKNFKETIENLITTNAQFKKMQKIMNQDIKDTKPKFSLEY